jgi:hypothetical protein
LPAKTLPNPPTLETFFILFLSPLASSQRKQKIESWGIGEAFGAQLDDKRFTKPNGMSFAVD